MQAEVTCPRCSHKQVLEVPQTGCQAFYKCENCKEMIGVPKESDNCCVICEYSDTTCPIGHKK